MNDAALLPAVAPRAASHVVLAVRSVPCGRRIWVTPTGLPLTVTTQSVRAYTRLLQDDSLIATWTNDVPPVALTCFRVGAVVSLYVKRSAFDGPAPLLVTVTFTVPAACAGVVAVIVVLPQDVTVAAAPPKSTPGNAGVHAKLVPLSVTTVPPARSPVAGLIATSVAVAPPAAPPTVASWK